MRTNQIHSHERLRRLQAMKPIGSIIALTMLGIASLHAASHPRLVLTPAPGFSITWDGNNGEFTSPGTGAGPSNNVALAANGTTAFGSTEFGAGVHIITNINDGLYGNSHSWIANFTIPDPNPFVGLRFAPSVNISNIAWGRDNGDTVGDPCVGGTCTDRNVGTYTLQYTAVPLPDASTAETGEPDTGWADIGTIQYLAGADDVLFTGYLRHRFAISEGGSPVTATGLRIKVSDPGICIDEIEVNPIPSPVPPVTDFIEITPAAGFAVSWDLNEGKYSTPNAPAPVPVNDASTARGATPFTSTDLGPVIAVPFHRAVNLNDGLYGNANSWIPNFVGGDAAPYAGINFGRLIGLRNIAWSRDNGNTVEGSFTDRALGVYVLQVTTVTNPGAATPDACGPNPESGWVTVGTINYKLNNLTYFNSHLRHRFDVSRGGNPIPATAVRILVPNSSIAIDEIEVNPNLAIENSVVRITNAPGATIAWDGNDGQFNNPAAIAAPPTNSALATAGTTPFASSGLGTVLALPFHLAVNLNDGLYGNANSWISANGIGGTSDPDPFVGLSFAASVGITNIAWGRDNGNTTEGGCTGGTCVDRALDTYRLQYTTVPAPDASTPDTGDAATGWQDVGTVTYTAATPPSFTPYLRHRFDISAGGLPLDATGIRIKVANGLTAIDEIEINTLVIPPAPLPALEVTPAVGYAIGWDGNDGHFNNPSLVAPPPANRALATSGTTAFGSSQLDFGVHFITNVIDGRYGNANSWIPNFTLPDPAPFIGLNFNGTVSITNLAWSRDNGNTVADCCGGTATDRVIGVYTLQFTAVASPDGSTPETGDASTGWENLGTVTYRRADAPAFNPHLRHRFDVSAGGSPVEATGIRIKVPDTNTDIDEIEVNTAAAAPLPLMSVAKSGTNAVISWVYGGGLECATSITGPWTCIGDALPAGYTVPLSSGPARFYRVRR